MPIEKFIESGFPFHQFLGVKVDKIDEESVRLYIPFKDELIGHADSAMIHGGVISTLADICGGFAVWTRCERKDFVATITLSVDYLRPAAACDLYAEATVRLLGNKVGNAHVVIWSEDNPEVHVAEGRGVYNIKRGKK
ncbi:hotdog fold thioesterase [Pseudodesulfovibrio cashew]|uniref:Medium/long-chain acyl-CoA thioesterase YigI n=1 Tax=Pseudodesulfovibrio cashew TaxID=2678688 RepID=A0A6I6JDZ5_9BACT|nr:PaaI family thioesterase [Pseudodesulfovibrio cashew]QGY41076.1 hotdog fold thioesterase [Pseudodesulfovibrio cashew]